MEALLRIATIPRISCTGMEIFFFRKNDDYGAGVAVELLAVDA